MSELRLVGVHDDGKHLLLSGSEGETYVLALDEALRTAVGKGAQRSTRSAAPGSVRMTPREIQALIRSGATAAAVSEQSGLPLEQVRRYEGPVLAERDYIARQARAVEVAAAPAHAERHSLIFSDEAVTLEMMVQHRLKAFGVDLSTLSWDAWRDSAGTWTITADFDSGEQWAATSIGESAPAVWHFQPSRKALQNGNRWAQQLSELEPVDGPVPARRLSAVADKPFDVEAEAPAEEPVQETPDESAHGLLDMLRSRRGVRLGTDQDGDDELAAMLGTARGEAGGDSLDETAEPSGEPEAAPKKLRAIPFLSLAPRLDPEEHDSFEPDGVSAVSTETREVVLSGEPTAGEPAAPEEKPQPRQEPAAPAEAMPSDSEVAARLERKAAAKPKRSSVPSWDEIVFGTKGD